MLGLLFLSHSCVTHLTTALKLHDYHSAGPICLYIMPLAVTFIWTFTSYKFNKHLHAIWDHSGHLSCTLYHRPQIQLHAWTVPMMSFDSYVTILIWHWQAGFIEQPEVVDFTVTVMGGATLAGLIPSLKAWLVKFARDVILSHYVLPEQWCFRLDPVRPPSICHERCCIW